MYYLKEDCIIIITTSTTTATIINALTENIRKKGKPQKVVFKLVQFIKKCFIFRGLAITWSSLKIH